MKGSPNSDDMGVDFAIIGGGLTATAMLCQLVGRLRQGSKPGGAGLSGMRIQVFEKQDRLGPGFPHNDRFVLPFHITNMCASDMGVIDGKPGDFQDWVTENFDRLQSRYTWFQEAPAPPGGRVDPCNHYPRAIMGVYLETRFQEAVDSARGLGVGVELFPMTEVVGLTEDSGKVNLGLKDLESESRFSRMVDRVLLATGHWFEKTGRDGYFTSPWPAQKLLKSIPDGERIAVIGTSLSAIETLLTLTSDGEFTRSVNGELLYALPRHSRRICLYSRGGLLPKVRGRMGRYQNRFLNRENIGRLLSEKGGNLALHDVFRLLNSELEEAYGRAIDWDGVVKPTGKPADLLAKYIDEAVSGDGAEGEVIWQTVINQCLDLAREIYLNLRPGERHRFDRDYTAVFFTHVATQPRVNAEKLLALVKAGIVDVVRLGSGYRFVRDEVTGCYEFIYTDLHGRSRRDAYRYVVNARGQERSLETDPSDLAKSLIRSGIVQIEKFSPPDPNALSKCVVPPGSEGSRHAIKTGGIRIDPKTHRIMKQGPGKRVAESGVIYAAGAMTRSQIINASMVRSIVEGTARIADTIVNDLVRSSNGRTGA